MIIDRENLRALGISFNTLFRQGLGSATPMWQNVATEVPSSTGLEEYGWLKNIPQVREWIGDRQINNLSGAAYQIRNKRFELTIGVDSDDIEDDNIGQYSMRFQLMGESVGLAYDTAVWGMLKSGFSTKCYDGQYYFDTDHPVIGEDGGVASVANTDGGAGTPWFLMSTRQVLKPVVLQIRKRWNFVNKDRDTDDNVFDRAEYVYGVDGRFNTGFAFWQTCWGSKQTLDAAHYATARAALMGMKRDRGGALGIVPNLLVVPPTLESAARKILSSENAAGGETNEWKGTAELLVVPHLA